MEGHHDACGYMGQHDVFPGAGAKTLLGNCEDSASYIVQRPRQPWSCVLQRCLCPGLEWLEQPWLQPKTE